jgi:predicted GH43/DUF377 family glycosyl hydrolase
MTNFVRYLGLLSIVLITAGGTMLMIANNLAGQNSIIETAMASSNGLLDLTSGTAAIAGTDSIRISNFTYAGSTYSATITLKLDGTWTISNVESAPEKSWVPQAGTVRSDTTSTSSILLPDGKIRTYFLSEEGNFVFAESKDGSDLSQTTTTSINNNNGQSFISNPAVLLLADGTCLMVYEISENPPPNQGNRTLFVATSTDGIQFGSPAQLPSSSLDLSPEGTIFQSVPDLVQLSDGTILLYYVANGSSTASMRSTDGGLTWIQDSDYRLGTAATGEVDPSAAYVDPDVVLETNGKSTMFLAYSEFETTCGGLGCQRFRIARSDDGLKFEMEEDDLLVAEGSALGLIDPDVYQTADGEWHMLYGEIKGMSIDLRHAVYK